MKFCYVLCALAALASHSANASEEIDFGVSLEGGYRSDDLVWSTGAKEVASKLSELSYEDVRIYEVSALFNLKVSEGLFSGVYTEFDVSWGKIDKGDSTDKDWQNIEDRSQLTNFSYSDVKGDDVLDYSLAVG